MLRSNGKYLGNLGEEVPLNIVTTNSLHELGIFMTLSEPQLHPGKLCASEQCVLHFSLISDISWWEAKESLRAHSVL